jgi:hypothetical protein
MKTQIWNRTTIVWGMSSLFDVKTNIPVDDWYDKKEKLFYTVHDLRVTSSPDQDHDRRGVIKLKIFRVSVGATTQRAEIISRLGKLDDSILNVSDGNGYIDPFKVTYQLKKGESFCDSAFKKVRLIFERFGIEDEKGYILSNFMPIQETLVKTKKNGWIPFGDYLRLKQKLPQMCSMYKTAISIDDLNIIINYQKAESNWLHHING